MKKGIFIAATGQNVGKTTTCLGILAGLKKRFHKVGFIKPVGQRHVKVDGDLHVDKDVALFKEYFSLPEDYRQMSPVLLPSGFTRSFLDGEERVETLLDRIEKSYTAISSTNEFTIVEGTGHIGVGSIVEINNARVAAFLGLDVVIIAPGGLGSAFDELALNINMCEHYDVHVSGIILNKVLPDKMEMIREYFPKALKRWGIPLLGCIPFSDLLSQPSMNDFENLFNTKLLSGQRFRLRRFKHHQIGARSPESFLERLQRNQLTITPATREDIVHATLAAHDEANRKGEPDLEGGLILTGIKAPSEKILKEIRAFAVPVIYVPHNGYDVLRQLMTFIAKIQREDLPKVEEAIKTVEGHIDFERLCKAPFTTSRL